MAEDATGKLGKYAVTRAQLIIEQDIATLTSFLPEIQSLADSEKDDALGFLPAKAFEEAIGRQRLIVALADQGGIRSLAGYLLYSGVFPNAKIQQIATVHNARKSGVASALVKALASDLERLGFLSIRADVASNLSVALAFYAKNGFQPIRKRAGGSSRGRTIIIHSRELETDNLFSFNSQQSKALPDLEIRRRTRSEVPVFAFDLNVYFDLVRQRDQSEQARRLFGEALGHNIRLAVADEFVAELRKTSNGADPILQLALQLPRLPRPDTSELNQLAARVYETIFLNSITRGAGTSQAKSDAKHIAHAAISGASAFVTRDGPILRARKQLLASFGIDVATVEEVLDLLPQKSFVSNSVPLRGEGFEPGSIDASQLSEYLLDVKVPSALISEYANVKSSSTLVHREAIRCDDRIVAVAVAILSTGVDAIARMIVHVRHEHEDAELFADYLLDSLIRVVCEGAPVTIQLAHVPGQSVVNKIASARGFHRMPNETTFSKVAMGRPLTTVTWAKAALQVQRKTGLVLPDSLSTFVSSDEISICTPAGISKRISAETLENLLGPTLFVWPGRDGVIVPITRSYADELLGTAIQANFGFIANRDAAFLSLRGYVNTPRSVKKMRVGAPIIFYESKGKGTGRGAAVAVARIVNSVLVLKSQLPPRSDRRLVIDNPDEFSSTDDVLLTTFDNLMVFPTPVNFDKLKTLDAVGRANLISAVLLSSEKVTSILSYGWSDDKI